MSVDFTPVPIAPGTFPTAAALNANGSVPWAGIQAAWEDYTPAWTGSTTNPAIGNGTVVGSFIRIGQTILFRIIVTMGSTTTFGAGQFRLSLPVAPFVGARIAYVTDYFDSSGPSATTGSATWDATSSTLTLNAPPTTAGNPNRAVTATAPFTWASGDVVTITGSYEAA